MLTTAKTGSRKSEIAAPGPNEPDSTPVLYAHVVTISVLNDGDGPPAVRMYTMAMSVAVKTIPNRSATVAIGNCSGSVTDQNLRRPVAPSIAAASSTSFGIEDRPARKITTAKGRIRHACTAITDPIASFGCARYCGTSSGQFRIE